MTLEEFEKLNKQTRREILEKEMLPMVNLMYEYPLQYKDFKNFAEWCQVLGFFDEELRCLLNGVYPQKLIEEKVDRAEIIRLSNNALRFVKSWNKYILLHY
jgi:hypothetical protein